MRSRIFILIVALALGGVAAVMAANYLNDARSDIEADGEPVSVLVAVEDIPRGLSSEELLARELIVLEEMPRRFVAAGAVSSERALEGQVLAAPLTAGEQVTRSRFEYPSSAGLAYSIPGDYMAIAIPVDEVDGVAGLVKPGDHIALYVTFSPGPDGEVDLTKLLISDAKVLASGGALRSESVTEEEDSGGLMSTSRSQSTSTDTAAPRTLTIAVSAADAERVVFAEETGEVWCALLPATAVEPPVGDGQTIMTVFE